jgi:hypothetical protein
MDKEKLQRKLEKFKAAAMGFIGAGIFTQGALYFQPQASYHVPRILYPIFEIAGNVGLAIGMLMLGLFLLYLGLNKWKNHGGASNHYLIIGAVGIVLFSGILWFSNQPKELKSSAEINARFDTEKDEQIDEIKDMQKPQFNNAEIEKYYTDFEVLQKQHVANMKANDTLALEKNEEDFFTWMDLGPSFYPLLATAEEKQQFARYFTKLSVEWQDTK